MKPLRLRRHHPAPRFVVEDADKSTVALRDYAFRRDLLLVLLHGPGCPDCARLAEQLVVHREDWEGWGTALLVLHEEAECFSDAFFRQGRDVDGAVRAGYGGPPADVVLAVIEHRGRLMDGWSLTHPEPVDWREVAETVRWVAVQEPECGACEVLPGWDEADTEAAPEDAGVHLP